jgi:uncharacterized surface protein with fasciclin (FAS1) repeats
LKVQHEKDVKLKKTLNQRLVAQAVDHQSQQQEHQVMVISLQTEARRLQDTLKEFQVFTVVSDC